MKSTRILGWVALSLVAGAAVIHCGGDDSNSTPPGGGGQGQGGSHAGSSGSAGTSGGSSGNMGAGGGASGTNQNTGGMAGTANTEGGAGTSGAGGSAGAGGGDSSTSDARDSASATDARDGAAATDSPANPADSGTDVTSSVDSGAADTGTVDSGPCPGTRPTDDTSCPSRVLGGCTYGQAVCFCQPAGGGADAGRTWQCVGPVAPDAAVDAGAGCPVAKPGDGTTCPNPSQLCRYAANSACVCVDIGAQNQWFCN